MLSVAEFKADMSAKGRAIPVAGSKIRGAKKKTGAWQSPADSPVPENPEIVEGWRLCRTVFGAKKVLAFLTFMQSAPG